MSSGGSPGFRDLRPLLELYDNGQSTASQTWHRVSGLTQSAVVFAGDILGSGMPWTARNGLRFRGTPAVFGHGARDALEVPLGQSLAAEPGLSNTTLPRRRWTREGLVRCGGGTGAFGIKASANGLDVAADQTGYELVVSTGRWLLRRRLVSGGPLEVPAIPVQLSSALWRPFAWIYTEGEDPRLEVYLSRVLLFTARGAALPAALASATSWYGFGFTSGANSVESVRGRWLVELL